MFDSAKMMTFSKEEDEQATMSGIPGGQVVGQDIPAAAGLRVVMAQGFKDAGTGTITATHANGGYCSVLWDNGTEDRCLFTGQQNDYYLVTCAPGYASNGPESGGGTPSVAMSPAAAQPGSGASPLGPPVLGQTRSGTPQAAAQPPVDSSMSGAGGASMQSDASRMDDAGAAQLHKQLLAQEVVKLRREVAALRASGKSKKGDAEDEDVNRAKLEIANLEQQKASIIAQANAQKALLAKEVKALRAELEGRGGGAGNAAMSPEEVALALERRREFEENFTRTLRDLRKELETTDLKSQGSKSQIAMGVRSMLQLSNERIEKVMEEAAQVPVEERLHIETLRLLMENCKLRKCLNDHSTGLLANTLSRVDDPGARGSTATSLFGII